MKSHRQSQPATLLGTAILLSILVSACSGEGEPAEAQVTGNDSTLAAILESAAEAAPRSAPMPTSPRLTPDQQDQQPLNIAEMGYDYGSDDAPVKVLELSDFGCGYCRRFTEETFPVLKEIYVDSGLIEWKFVPFVMGMFPNGLEAATAAECAGEQDEFYRMKERLFAAQTGWRNSDEPFSFLSQLAEDEGLDVERFNKCIVSGWRDAAIRANIRLGRQAGIQGTPLFLIDGRPVPGALPLEDFRDVLDAALQQRGLVPPPRG